MCTYHLFSPRVLVNCHSDLYIYCTTLKLATHIANIVWSTLLQREVLYTHNKVGLRLLQLKAWACTHTTRSALGLL